MSLNKSPIDYLLHSERLINRPGRSLNLVTGCKHHEQGICTVPCYARRMVEHGRLKGNKAYPYGFEPTFHPERIKHYKLRDKRPMLIFQGDMGDVGCDCNWIYKGENSPDLKDEAWMSPELIANYMRDFALLNPEHIILLLTKRPAWYGLAEWPDNVWCGKTATNNHELHGGPIMPDRFWLSLEPWLGEDAPNLTGCAGWVVTGGQSRPNKPVSKATLKWLQQPFDGKRFTKANVMAGDFISYGPSANAPTVWFKDLPQEYPDEFRYKPKGANDGSH